jgi:hypothetical protein
MAATGATPPFSLELLHPTLPRLAVLLTFRAAAVTPQIFSITVINANDQINRSNRSNTGQT